MQPLKDCFHLPPGSVVALIGSGGKTTLLYQLGEQLSQAAPVLLSTTTFLFPPTDGQVDTNWTDRPFPPPLPPPNGSTFVACSVPNSLKLSGIPREELELLAPSFPYTLLECDGSRMRPLKGWANHEPVIPPFITTTIGVLPLSVSGQIASDQTVHRLPLFTSLTGCQLGDTITTTHLAALIQHPKGLFGKAVGTLQLYFSHCDHPEDLAQAMAVIQQLSPAFSSHLTTIVAGNSLSGLGTTLDRGLS